MNSQVLFTIFICMGALFFLTICTRLCLRWMRVGFSLRGSNSLTMFLLPQITFLVTFVIKGDLALSLGLVGALSIVRFRNPVRSSLELAIYFFLIGGGIAASVDARYVVAFCGLIVGLSFLTRVGASFANVRVVKDLFDLQPIESNSFTLQIESKVDLHEQLPLKSLSSSEKLSVGDGEVRYTFELNSDDQNLIDSTYRRLSDDPLVTSLKSFQSIRAKFDAL